MSPPIRDGSGDSIGAIRLGDGSEISEVRTGAGDVLFSAAAPIPDSGLLHRYAADKLSKSDGQSVSTWFDTEQSADLTAGTAPTFKTSIINGNPVVRHDASNSEFLSASYGSSISEPIYYFIVGGFRTLNTNTNVYLLDGGSKFESSFGTSNNPQEFTIFAGGNFVNVGSWDTNYHIFTIKWDGISTTFRTDGTQTRNGDAGAVSTSGLTTGGDGSGGQNANVDIGEIAIYHNISTTTRDNVESHLSNKWGISI